jgi:kumamolisin
MKSATIFSILLLSLVQVSAQAKSVDLVLRLKDRVAMETLANNVMNSSSSHYGKFYTPGEIRKLAAPTAREYQELLTALAAKGMTVVSESKSHSIITVRTDSAQAESVFSTKLKVVGALFAGTEKAAVIPTDLALIDSITGFNQTTKRVPHYEMNPSKPNLFGFGAVSQADIKKGYGFDPIYASGITGKGQHISIATYDGFHMDDVNGFYVQSKISPAPVVDQVIFNGTPKVDENSAVETELDSEFTGMMAPGAAIHVFASADNSDAGELAMFTAILDDGRAKVVNYSWGACEAQTDPAHQADMDKVYARAIAQGVNIMVASGDSGADGCQTSAKVADWPASNPNVVAVGGTSFKLSSAGKALESGWKDSGGGISSFYALPAYQSNFQSPYVKRSFPDVAFNADMSTGEQLWTSCHASILTGKCSIGAPKWMTIGGTSMAAPQWSGFMTLVGEARAKAGKKPLGFLNPILYSMSAATKAAVLNDVTSGNNGYPAGQGWDAVTGWGSMQASALLEYLTNQ